MWQRRGRPSVRWRGQIRRICRRCNLLGRRQTAPGAGSGLPLRLRLAQEGFVANGVRARAGAAVSVQILCSCQTRNRRRRPAVASPSVTWLLRRASHWALVHRVRDEEMHVCFGMFRKPEGRRRQQLQLQCRRWNRGCLVENAKIFGCHVNNLIRCWEGFRALIKKLISELTWKLRDESFEAFDRVISTCGLM